MILKHLRVLEEAQLLILKKAGRKTELYFNSIPIQMIYDRWTSDYSAFWASKLVDLKMLIESENSPPPKPRQIPKKRATHEPN